MPTSPDWVRDLMIKWFGDIDAGPPLKFLLARGYVEKRGMLFPPVSAHKVSSYEWECICFLCDEWDFAYSGRLNAPRH